MTTKMMSAHAIAGRTSGNDEMRVCATVIALQPCMALPRVSS
jgi:hypothetical protein